MNSGPKQAVLVFAAVVLLLTGAFSGVARAQDQAQIDSLFAQAKDAWEQGHYDEAAKALKQLLAQDPSQETAYDLLRKVENKMLLDMLTRGGDSEKVARTLLELAHRGEMERTRDEAAIRDLVQKAVKGENFAVREKAVRELVAKHGEYAVPYLYPYLGSNDTDERVYAILALSELGGDAVLPLVEVLHSDEWLVQKNAAQVLERIGDVRAVGGLADLAATATNPEVQAAAQAAASRVANGMLDDMSPVNAYLWLARKYYAGDTDVVRNYLSGYTLWSWKDGQLASRDVPKYMYRLELAEEAAYDALAADAQSQEARNVLAAVQYAEWGTLNGLSEEAKATEETAQLMDRYWNVLPITMAQGTDTQLGALSLGLEWGDPWICRLALGALPDVWDGREITGDCALVAALDAPDKTVRFAAAIAALRLDPEMEFEGADKVAPLAAQAVAAGSLRQVLLVEPDAGTRTKATQALENAGLYVVAESTGMAGFVRAKEVGTFDVVVLRYDLPDALAEKIVRELRRDFRTQGLPILISGPEAELAEAKENFGTNVQGFIEIDPINVDEVNNAAEQSMNDDQKRALEVSKAACMALAMVDPAHTAFSNYGATETALADVLSSNKPDDIRLAALAALGRLGTAQSTDALVDTFSNSANATAIRVAAAGALGRVLRGMAAPANAYDALLGGLGDEAREVRAAAGAALGAMMLTPVQENEVLTKYRVE